MSVCACVQESVGVAVGRLAKVWPFPSARARDADASPGIIADRAELLWRGFCARFRCATEGMGIDGRWLSVRSRCDSLAGKSMVGI